ncbi:hypothetical protein L1049_017088 [Liquidambar formosana]|uniref:ER membrane protein complex subunit 6 n=1 Tax=Liquidambar formosana TaxID=63359 RepID=A0AAP0S2P0_LIQFO
MVIQEAGASGKKSSEAMNDVPTLSAEKLQSNMKVIYYSRTFLSIIGGLIAGILVFTGLTGFILYFLVMAVTSVGLIAKARFSVHSYFDCWNRVILDGFVSGLMKQNFAAAGAAVCCDMLLRRAGKGWLHFS